MPELVQPGSRDVDFSLSTKFHRRFALRRIKWFGIGALGIGTSAFAIAVFYILRDDPQQRFFPVLLAVLYFVITFLAVSAIYGIDKIQNQLEVERRSLDEQIETERRSRQDGEWLETAVRSITSQFKGSLASERITELVTEGLGRELLADGVIFYTFDESLWPGFVKQWHRQPDQSLDEAIIPKFELELSTMVHDLWNRNSVVTVNDSHLIDISTRPIPDASSIAKDLARSWVLAPVADGSTVLGFVSAMMRDVAREWSAIEISLMKEVASEAASATVHARIFNQSLEIAANDAEVERLVELGKVKNSFIENMNHELRTPLTSIIGYLEVIIDDVDAGVEPELASTLTAVQRNAFRLQLLIENMMQISKTDLNHVPLVVTTVDVGHLLGDVVNSLQLGAEDGGVSMILRLDSPADDLIIDGDVHQLEQVFFNLLSNAIKFTLRDGSVTVVARRIHADGDCVEVKVADTGIGIPAKEFPNVFQRFFRATTATQASIPGFGIGLSLVHSIVSEHNGTVAFDSTVGNGTVFTVTLPSRQRTSRKPKVTV